MDDKLTTKDVKTVLRNLQEYCYLRLPCGICRLSMTNCPKVSEVYSITPTWVSTNCEVNIHTNNEVTE